MQSGEVVLDVKNLRTYFFTRRGVVKAVDGVSFSLRKGETLGIVGESGCGKSVTSLSLLRLLPKPAGKIVGGEIWLMGEELLQKSEREMRRIRGKVISLVLQDSTSSLNPVFTAGFQVREAIQLHQIVRGETLRERAIETMRLLRISSPEVRYSNYPHEISGGMRQRVVGAIGLSCQPMVLIADEPTTSLDVTTQAQYLQVLKDIQRESGMSLIFITHDFGIVAQTCDQVAVMYAGRVVERGPVLDIFDHPAHPYTQALLGAVPRSQGRGERLPSIGGLPPALDRLPSGCHFNPRCSHAMDSCYESYPPEVEVSPGHFARCWLNV